MLQGRAQKVAVKCHALSSAHNPSYCKTDEGTARCRLSLGMFELLNIQMGWVIRIQFGDEIEGVVVLCTSWPHISSMSRMADRTIVLNDAIYVGKAALKKQWTEMNCKIIAVYPPRICTSMRLQWTTNSYSGCTDALRAALSGFPLEAGCQLRGVKGLPFLDIIDVASSTPCIVSFTTSVVAKAAPITRGSGTDGSSSADGSRVGAKASTIPSHASGSTQSTGLVGAACETKAVQQLYRRLVRPVLQKSNRSILGSVTGVLLSGPPGTGKTFAVRALQQMCEREGKIKIIIMDLNIPKLLSVDDPLQKLDEVFTLANEQAQGVRVSYDTDVTVPVTTAKKSIVYTPSPSTPRTPVVSTTLAQPFTPMSFGSSVSGSGSGYRHVNPGYTHTPHTPSTPMPSGTSQGIVIPTFVCIVLDEMDALGRTDSTSSGSGHQNATQVAIKAHICKWCDSRGQIIRPLGSATSLLDCTNGGATATAAGNFQHTTLMPTNCCIIGTTNRPNAIDEAFRRGGRFEVEINVNNSNAEDRMSLIETMLLGAFTRVTSSSHLTPSIANGMHISEVAKFIGGITGGYVAADLSSLVAHAVEHFVCDIGTSSLSADTTPVVKERDQEASHAWSKSLTTLLQEQCLNSMKIIRPSSLRSQSDRTLAVATGQAITFDDIVGHAAVKDAISRVLMFSDAKKSNLIQKFGLGSPGGVLLYGPPGGSKTRLIKAAAYTYHLPLITLSSADVYSAYVGEAEAEIRRVFAVARQVAPCMLFLDELDALVTNRDNDSNGTSAESKVLATLLVEMDGINSQSGGTSNSPVFVFGATNRKDCIDAALLRKGRFHEVIYVGPPSQLEVLGLIDYFGFKFGLSPESVEKLKNSCKYCNAEGDTAAVTGGFDKKIWSEPFSMAVAPGSTTTTTYDSVVTAPGEGGTVLTSPAVGSAALPAGRTISGAEVEYMCREEAMRFLRSTVLSTAQTLTNKLS